MKRLLTAVQPTNQLTLGNYLGVIKEITKLQNDHECFIFIADLHSITVPYNPQELKGNVLRVLASYLSCGLDPLKCSIFLQSQIPEHSQLKHLLSAFVSVGQLGRMHQFKEKKKDKDMVALALLDYPVLMAADILLYEPDLVPVGSDQLQHLELTRGIAQVFNRKHPGFKIPEAHYSQAPKIMSLQDPTQKMSKSDPNSFATIFLTDSDQMIDKKLSLAVTDSGKEIILSDDKPGIKNLLIIQSSLTDKPIDEIVEGYRGKLYGQLKKDTAQIVKNHLGPIRDKIEYYLKNEDELQNVLIRGKLNVQNHAKTKLEEIKTTMGFLLF
jgi:tryptophanyl-tRNA synthetase